mmetsp:Transcript_27259/g.46052  ORF Transcript_27259/g.46052 Transcript_27259/m.46052 type:complete len:84 (+) Transcript_27259:556-807(+)
MASSSRVSVVNNVDKRTGEIIEVRGSEMGGLASCANTSFRIMVVEAWEATTAGDIMRVLSSGTVKCCNTLDDMRFVNFGLGGT